MPIAERAVRSAQTFTKSLQAMITDTTWLNIENVYEHQGQLG